MLQFEHTQTRDDGGGFVTITANSTEEVGQMLKHFNFGRREPSLETLLAEAEMLKAGHWVKVRKSEKRPWYVYDGEVEQPFLEPYAETLLKVAGFKFSDVTLDLTQVHPLRLNHGYLTNWMRLEKGRLTYQFMIDSEDWNGRTAKERVPISCNRYAREAFGRVQAEPEFIELNNGFYKRNPNYATGQSKVHPHLACEWFWEALMDWWRDNHATSGQKDCMAECEKCCMSIWQGKNVGRHASFLIGYHGLTDYNGLRVNWGANGVVSWEKFKTL